MKHTLEGLVALNATLAGQDAAGLPDDAFDHNKSNVICAANEARFTSAFFSEPLTQYAVGWKDDENLDQMLEDLFPGVEVGRRFEYKAAVNANEFLVDSDDARPIGSSFKRVEFPRTSVLGTTVNRGLTIRIDHDETQGDAWRELAVQRLLMRLKRSEIKRGIAALDAAATNTAKTWSASVSPDSDLRTAIRTFRDAVGITPNMVAYGDAAWDIRANSYELQNTPAAGLSALMTPQQLASKMGLDRVVKVKARYSSSATAKTAIVAALVYIYQAERNLTPQDASTIKRFVTPTDSGRFKVYVQQHEKFTDISVEHYSNVIVTSTLGVQKLTITAG